MTDRSSSELEQGALPLEGSDIAEDVQEAVETLEADEPVAALQQILSSPKGREVLEQVMVTAISVHEERHSGPLPSPRQLNEYELTVPGGAERIFQMAEREQHHRHLMQAGDAEFRGKAFAHIQTRESRGQTIGGLLALGVLCLSAYMTYLGHPAIGASLAGTTLVGIAAVFVTGRRRATPPLPASKPDDDQEAD